MSDRRLLVIFSENEPQFSLFHTMLSSVLVKPRFVDVGGGGKVGFLVNALDRQMPQTLPLLPTLWQKGSVSKVLPVLRALAQNLGV